MCVVHMGSATAIKGLIVGATQTSVSYGLADQCFRCAIDCSHDIAAGHICVQCVWALPQH
jgi:hypothetical protein